VSVITALNQAESIGVIVLGGGTLIIFVGYFVKMAWHLSNVLTKLDGTLLQLLKEKKEQDAYIHDLQVNDRLQDLTLKDHTTKLEWLMKE